MKYYKVSLEGKSKNCIRTEELFAENSFCRPSAVKLIPRSFERFGCGFELSMKAPAVKMAAAAVLGVSMMASAPAEAADCASMQSSQCGRISLKDCYAPNKAAVEAVCSFNLGNCVVESFSEDADSRFIAGGAHQNAYQHTNTAPTSHKNSGWANHSNAGGNHSNSDWTNHCNTKIDGTSHVNMMHGDFLF